MSGIRKGAVGQGLRYVLASGIVVAVFLAAYSFAAARTAGIAIASSQLSQAADMPAVSVATPSGTTSSLTARAGSVKTKVAESAAASGRSVSGGSNASGGSAPDVRLAFGQMTSPVIASGGMEMTSGSKSSPFWWPAPTGAGPLWDSASGPAPVTSGSGAPAPVPNPVPDPIDDVTPPPVPTSTPDATATPPSNPATGWVSPIFQIGQSIPVQNEPIENDCCFVDPGPIPGAAVQVPGPDGTSYQVVTIDLTKGYYDPNRITIRANEPTEMWLTAGPVCVWDIIFSVPGGMVYASPGDAGCVVVLPAMPPGSYGFHCGMYMTHGWLYAE